MPAPIVTISVQGIYGKPPGLLPARMARCAPDFRAAIRAIANDVAAAGGRLALSDLFRTYLMQLQAHADYVSGKKKAFSPAPGGSMHEAGRAMDIDVGGLGITLGDFWTIAKAHGVVPIIGQPKPGASESWHFEGRGSHQRVYDYYVAKGLPKPARGMATSAIVAIGQRHDEMKDLRVAQIQSALIRLGFDPGVIDGAAGTNTKNAAAAAGVSVDDPNALATLEARLRLAFPDEWALDGGESGAALDSLVAGPRLASLTPEEEAATDEHVLWIDQKPRRSRRKPANR